MVERAGKRKQDNEKTKDVILDILDRMTTPDYELQREIDYNERMINRPENLTVALISI